MYLDVNKWKPTHSSILSWASPEMWWYRHSLHIMLWAGQGPGSDKEVRKKMFYLSTLPLLCPSGLTLMHTSSLGGVNPSVFKECVKASLGIIRTTAATNIHPRPNLSMPNLNSHPNPAQNAPEQLLH